MNCQEAKIIHTFNLGLVFGDAADVVIIVCASEHPIDRDKINCTATMYFQEAATRISNAADVVNYVAAKIQQDCGCQTVVVTADCACHIPTK